MNRKPLVLAGLVATVALGCVGAASAPSVAAAQHTPAVARSVHRQPAQLTAKPDKLRIKRGERVTVRGRLTVGQGHTAAPFVTDTEPLLVQELTAAGWTTIETDSCEPGGDFAIQLSFGISADLTLRVFHPETDLYAAAFAEFELAVS